MEVNVIQQVTWSSHLQQLVSNSDASVPGRRSSGVESHHEDAEEGSIPVSCQTETETLPLLLQLHAQQLPLQVGVTLTPTLCSETESTVNSQIIFHRKL